MLRSTRPVLALALLLMAALACSITISQTRLEGARLFRDPAGTEGTRSFERDETFYARVTLRHADDGARIRAVWRAVDVGADHAAFEIASEQVEAANGLLTFALVPPTEGWLPGNYALSFEVNGESKLTLDFTVKGKR